MISGLGSWGEVHARQRSDRPRPVMINGAEYDTDHEDDQRACKN